MTVTLPQRGHDILRDSTGLRAPAAHAVLVDPTFDPHEGLVTAMREQGVTLEPVGDPLRALARASAIPTLAVVVSAALEDPMLSGFVAVVRDELDLPVLLAYRAGDADRLGAAVLAGARPVVDQPYQPERLARTLLELATRSDLRPLVRVGLLELDPGAYDARLRGRGIDLSTLEFEVLHELATHPDHVVPRERFTHRYWPHSPDPDGTLAAVISRLRRKLDAHDLAGVIHTVRGIGFRLESTVLHDHSHPKP
ncbi:winged helix-turn-helix transcriptional regulator [Cellulosimicrobium funkei]|uniref:Response regulator transcription factor n=1 Tax=Cellulosimicrobium funkei TaxID=264251 RepID=A0A4Y8QXK6_9MICO|nr:winged helix-turn-helix domain-containing protein [Cellulosimicrobium funkei]TFF04432.1 response regulator transcription factor [Cellulosimicrobium funkei]TGA67903.1 response regulator transcription factor [Cellulosimicrobium terreum]